MTDALMLIRTHVGAMEEVYEKIKGMKKVQRAAMVTGPYDIMVIIEGENIEEITKRFIQEVRDIEGVKETTTNIFIE